MLIYGFLCNGCFKDVHEKDPTQAEEIKNRMLSLLTLVPVRHLALLPGGKTLVKKVQAFKETKLLIKDGTSVKDLLSSAQITYEMQESGYGVLRNKIEIGKCATRIMTEDNLEKYSDTLFGSVDQEGEGLGSVQYGPTRMTKLNKAASFLDALGYKGNAQRLLKELHAVLRSSKPCLTPTDDVVIFLAERVKGGNFKISDLRYVPRKAGKY